MDVLLNVKLQGDSDGAAIHAWMMEMWLLFKFICLTNYEIHFDGSMDLLLSMVIKMTNFSSPIVSQSYLF